jgi:hypothetical protein
MRPTRRPDFRALNPAKRIRTMKTSRDFCGIIVTGPHRSTILLNFRYSSKTCGSLRVKRSSTRYRPHECHMFADTNFAPHFGQVQSGGSGLRGIAEVQSHRRRPPYGNRLTKPANPFLVSAASSFTRAGSIDVKLKHAFPCLRFSSEGDAPFSSAGFS